MNTLWQDELIDLGTDVEVSEHKVIELEDMLTDFFNQKIDTDTLKQRYQNYCSVRDM
jgi:hypothetical protein